MKIFSFYFVDSGMFSGLRVSCGDMKKALQSAPEGQRPIEGCFSSSQHRIDIDTGEIVSHLPPKPSDDHEWDGRQWVLTHAAAVRKHEIATAQSQIDALEAKQNRAIREALLGNAEAQARIADIDQQIATLRAIIRANTQV